MILDDGNKETLQCVSILVVMACIVQVHKKNALSSWANAAVVLWRRHLYPDDRQLAIEHQHQRGAARGVGAPNNAAMNVGDPEVAGLPSAPSVTAPEQPCTQPLHRCSINSGTCPHYAFGSAAVCCCERDKP